MLKQLVTSYSIFITDYRDRLRKRNWFFLIHWLHLVWTMHVLVKKYANDHPQALRSKGAEEPKCTLLMLSLPRTRWLHANCPSGIIICPCCGLSCAQEFGPHCVSTHSRLENETHSRAWKCFLAVINFRTRPKIVKKEVYFSPLGLLSIPISITPSPMVRISSFSLSPN